MTSARSGTRHKWVVQDHENRPAATSDATAVWATIVFTDMFGKRVSHDGALPATSATVFCLSFSNHAAVQGLGWSGRCSTRSGTGQVPWDLATVRTVTRVRVSNLSNRLRRATAREADVVRSCGQILCNV